MARAGIYKSEVLRARDKLLATGRYPSIDAGREELGNTGSKGTIHRYLKEIEEEEGPPTGSRVAVSEAIQDLVGAWPPASTKRPRSASPRRKPNMPSSSASSSKSQQP